MTTKLPSPTTTPLLRATGSGLPSAISTPLANRPIPCLAFALTCAVQGREPRAFHLMSLWLHAANALLLFLVLHRIMARPFTACTTAFAFLRGISRPLHAQSV